MISLQELGWEIWACDPRGFRLQLLDKVSRFDTALIANNLGAFNITLPGTFDTEFLQLDNIIEFWRAGQTRASGRTFTGFMRKFHYHDVGGQDFITVSGPDQMTLLDSRIVAYYAGSTESDKTDYADDMIKELVSENIGSGADDYSGSGTARDLSGYNFTVAADTSLAPSITKAFAWRNLLVACQDVALASETAGTPLYFVLRVIEQDDRTLGFDLRTNINQLFGDRTQGATPAHPVLFGKKYGNLESPSLTYDYTAEMNYIYAGGQGEESGRNIQSRSDSDRIGKSVWNRREGFADARNHDTDAGVQSVGDEVLAEAKPSRIFTANLIDTPQARYGIDWFFGDKITCEYMGIDFDGMIKAVEISVRDNGLEQIRASIEVEE